MSHEQRHRREFYEGRPVKRKRKVVGGILLTFVNEIKGSRGEQLVVTQAQLDAGRTLQDVPDRTMDCLRRLATKCG